MSSSTNTTDSARIRRIVTPSHYDLHYSSIDLEQNTFAGSVSIVLTLNPSSTPKTTVIHGKTCFIILIHALELNLEQAELVKVNEEEGDKYDNMDSKSLSSLEAIHFQYSPSDQICNIYFPQDELDPFLVMKHLYKLNIQFNGVLNANMQGLYRSSYENEIGIVKRIATTQFEPTDARRAFPCFDEPNLKATFCLQVTLPVKPPHDTMKCISNTPIVSSLTTYNPNDKSFSRIVSFQKTPLMSTYLLALVIGEFDSISVTSDKTRITTTVYTVPGKVNQGKFCLDVATQCLDLYKDLFDVEYPLVKSDLLAIPDFAAGAMENWGCVTYREAKILVKEGSTSETMKRGIARTVCHELAHQWFGNLVTMDFWTQLWLNEGFARFMEFVGIESIFPEWDVWTEFVQSVYGLALSLDSMKSSHPVEVEVRHPDEINAIFDAISYAKGASVIRMLSSLIGFNVFMEGLKIYLKRHAYGNAVTEMLWESLAEAAKMPIADLMSPWTSQTGFPLLILNDNDFRNISTPRFLASGPESGDEEDLSCSWPIPITAQVEGEKDVFGPWILNDPAGGDISALYEKLTEWSASGKWFKLNVSQTGFYRVAYTQKQWERLAPVMSPDGPLSASDRLGLISDSFAIGRAGYAPIIDSLKLIQEFGNHDNAEYAVWQELSENLANLASIYRSEPFYEDFQCMLKKLYSKQMKILGWDPLPNESQRTGTLRGTVINILRTAGDKDVIVEAFSRFKRFIADPEQYPIPGDLRSIVFKAALRYDEKFVYDKMREIFEKSMFPEEQRACLSVMGSVLDMGRHKEAIDYVLFSGKVRLQDIAFPLHALTSSSDKGGRACWNMVKADYDRLSAQFSSGPMWAGLLGLCARGLTTLKEADEVEQFFQDPSHPCGSGKRRLEQALEAVRNKAVRLERDREEVSDFLSKLN